MPFKVSARDECWLVVGWLDDDDVGGDVVPRVGGLACMGNKLGHGKKSFIESSP